MKHLAIILAWAAPAVALAHPGHPHTHNEQTHHLVEGGLLFAGLAVALMVFARLRKNARN